MIDRDKLRSDAIRHASNAVKGGTAVLDRLSVMELHEIDRHLNEVLSDVQDRIMRRCREMEDASKGE